MADQDLRTRPDHGAHSATGRRRKPLGWLPWVALALLLLLAALIFLLVRNVGDSGDEGGVDVVDDPTATAPATADGDSASATAGAPPATAAGDDASGSPTSTAGAADADAGAGAGASAGGTLTAGGASILPVPAEGLVGYAGQPVTGTAVRVESVVADEGFWVGSSATDRVFVFLTPQARTTEGESPFQIEAGQLIDVEGALVALPSDPASLGVDADEGADQLATQGHLVEATSVAQS